MAGALACHIAEVGISAKCRLELARNLLSYRLLSNVECIRAHICVGM